MAPGQTGKLLNLILREDAVFEVLGVISRMVGLLNFIQLDVSSRIVSDGIVGFYPTRQ